MKAKQDFPNLNERPAAGLNEEGRPYKVLVVDDSMFVTKQLSQILTSEGFEVAATAADGAQAVEKYKELYPGVPAELRMPDTRWSHLREYYCPSCGSLLQVEHAVPGYPVVHDFVPDIEGFYREWLGRPVPVE